ncbi:hypothetical protein D3C72_2057060 [compost metagenome]
MGAVLRQHVFHDVDHVACTGDLQLHQQVFEADFRVIAPHRVDRLTAKQHGRRRRTRLTAQEDIVEAEPTRRPGLLLGTYPPSVVDGLDVAGADPHFRLVPHMRHL